jgi:hypothetical protein
MGAAPVTPVGECSRADHGLYRGDIGGEARRRGKRGRFFQSPRTRTARQLPVSPPNDAMTLGAGVSLSASRHKAMIFVTGNDIGVDRYFSVQG